jgi:hypothetical protein
MPSLSEVVVQELLSEKNTYRDRFTLSIKIAGKDLHSIDLSTDEKNEVNRILKNKNIPIHLT